MLEIVFTCNRRLYIKLFDVSLCKTIYDKAKDTMTTLKNNFILYTINTIIQNPGRLVNFYESYSYKVKIE